MGQGWDKVTLSTSETLHERLRAELRSLFRPEPSRGGCMRRGAWSIVAVGLALVFGVSAKTQAQCAGGAGAQTGLSAVSCTGAPAWTGQAVAAGATVTYNNCLYKANTAISANSAWAPGSTGVYLYGNGSACPTAGCNYGAQGPCGGTSATPTNTTPPRATATSTTPP